MCSNSLTKTPTSREPSEAELGGASPQANRSSANDAIQRQRRILDALKVQTDRAMQLESELLQARREIEQLHASIARFVSAVERIVAQSRNQRAWKIMLAIRRAYSLLFREGWAGRFRLLFGPRRPLHDYEIQFPASPSYLPVTRSNAPGEGHPSVAEADLTPARGYDVIVLAIIDFDFRFQRPQQIAAEYARKGHRVFWISATRVLPADAPPYEIVEIRKNIWELHVRAPQLDLYRDHLTSDALDQFREGILRFFRDWAVCEFSILAQLPFWRTLALSLRREPLSVLAYDCMDDWDAFENLSDFNRSEELRLASECDVLLVTAEKLRTKFTAQALEPVLVRNGADFEFFRIGAAQAGLADLPRPVVGYFGAIADWIDLDLIAEAAAARPQYSFVLAGQIFGRDTLALEALPNVRMLGPRPYQEMPSLLSSFDVCIIPFKLNQVTHATDPVKLYEYFSQGKPVVATDMEELRVWSDMLYLCSGASEFCLKLDAAVAEADPVRRSMRVDFARRNTWAARVEQIDASICRRLSSVSIVIVTHNSAEFIGPCLQSVILDTKYPNVEIIVADNASTDDSVRIARSIAAFDSRIKVEAFAENLGFSGGNNAAVRVSSGEYVLLLNADTMVTPGWLGRLIRHLEADSSIGLICPVTNFAGNEAKINFEYTREREMEQFAMCLARQHRGEVFELSVVPLYCAMLRRDLWNELGGLDESYEIGMFEDDDLSAKINNYGLRVAAAEDCFVHHFGQGSFNKLSPEEYHRIFETNRRRFEAKWKRPWVPHHTRPGVKPPLEEQRFHPKNFCETDILTGRVTAAACSAN